MPIADRKVLKDLLYAFGGFRLSKDSNQFSVGFSRNSLDGSGYEDPADRVVPGTRKSTMPFSGFLSAREVYLITMLNDEAQQWPLTLCLTTTKVAGDAAILGVGTICDLQVGGNRGVVAPFSSTLYTDEQFHGFVLGQLLYNNVGAAAIGSGVTNGTGLNLGALGAGQVAIFTFNVVDPPGITGTTPTLNTLVESATSGAFSSPITRATFTQVTTTPTGYVAVIDGDVTPVTDTWWRAKHTAAGTTPGYTVLMGAAIVSK